MNKNIKKYRFSCTLFAHDLRLNIECLELKYQEELKFTGEDQWKVIIAGSKSYDVHLLYEGVDLDWEVSIYLAEDYSEESQQIVDLTIHDDGIDEGDDLGDEAEFDEDEVEFVVYYNPETLTATIDFPNGSQIERNFPVDVPTITILYEGLVYRMTLVKNHAPGEVYRINAVRNVLPGHYEIYKVVTYIVNDDEPEDEEPEEADCIAREYEWICVGCGHMNIFYEWKEEAFCCDCGDHNNIGRPRQAYE